jgi:hypothetical protein
MMSGKTFVRFCSKRVETCADVIFIPVKLIKLLSNDYVDANEHATVAVHFALIKLFQQAICDHTFIHSHRFARRARARSSPKIYARGRVYRDDISPQDVTMTKKIAELFAQQRRSI